MPKLYGIPVHAGLFLLRLLVRNPRLIQWLDLDMCHVVMLGHSEEGADCEKPGEDADSKPGDESCLAELFRHCFSVSLVADNRNNIFGFAIATSRCYDVISGIAIKTDQFSVPEAANYFAFWLRCSIEGDLHDRKILPHQPSGQQTAEFIKQARHCHCNCNRTCLRRLCRFPWTGSACHRLVHTPFQRQGSEPKSSLRLCQEQPT